MRDALRSLIVTGCCATACLGCGTRVPPPSVGAPPGTPRVSWVVMAGDRDNPDAQFICQSAPRTACVLTASRPNAKVWSTVYVYYHGVGAEVTYGGAIRVGFFEGPATESHEIRADSTLKANENIAHQSVVDDVATTPGTYTLAFDITATTGDHSQPLRETVSVLVK